MKVEQESFAFASLRSGQARRIVSGMRRRTACREIAVDDDCPGGDALAAGFEPDRLAVSIKDALDRRVQADLDAELRASRAIASDTAPQPPIG